MLNKTDLFTAEEAEERCNDIIKRLKWTGNVFKISGLSRSGTDELAQEVMRYLETNTAIETDIKTDTDI